LSDIGIRAHNAASEEDVFLAVGDGLKACGLRSTLALLDEMLDRFRVVYASTARPILAAAERLFGARGIGYEVPRAESFTLGQAVRERTAVYVQDSLRDPQPGPRESRLSTVRRGIELLDAKPHIAAPLIARDRVLGAIAVQAAGLTEDDCAPILAFAGQAALAIDNLRRRAEAAGRERQLSIIVQINQTVSADLMNVGRAYDVVLREVKRLVEFDQADLAQIDPATGQVRMSSPGTTLPGEAEGTTSYPLPGSVVEWVMAHDGPYLCKDTNTEQEFTETRQANTQNMRSFIALPLRHRGQTLGAFILKNRIPYFYGERDTQALAPIVDQMAIALVNYRLFDQVERGRRQLQAVLDSTGDAVIATDTLGRVALMNPAAERLFESEGEPATGLLIWDAIEQPALADGFRRAVREKIGAPIGFEIPLNADSILFADLAPILDARGSTLGWMAVIRDITHFKRLEALRSEAIATAAHDLKSPLHLASGALGVLAEDALTLSEDQLEALNIAQSGLRRMRMLIDDLLDLKKIEDGFGIVKRDCPLEAVLKSVVSEATAAAAARDQALTLDLQGALPVIQADADRLHQVFANLVGNAIKYTQEGGAVTARAQIAGANVQVAVIDNGPGISHDDQAHIFEKFYRARGAASAEGTGMGLAIVKSIVEQHSGQIIVQSAPGQGSQFIVTLPIGGG
jgi:two-component system phosphate regulon sensor histidine kinase PhoR